MNSEYAYSIIDLYLKREIDNKKTVLNIKKLDDTVEFSFNMNELDSETTNFVIPFDEYSNNLVNYINQYKQDLMIIDEKYDYDKNNSSCYYYVKFKNGRVISFDGFNILDTNNIRNILYDIKINKQEVRVDNINEEKQMAYKPRLQLQQAGFTSYATLFLVALIFVGVLVLALFIIKAIVK